MWDFMRELSDLKTVLPYSQLPIDLICRKIGIERAKGEYYLKFLIATRLITYGNGLYDLSNLKKIIGEFEKLPRERVREIWKESRKEWYSQVKNFWIKNWYLAPLSAVIENAYKEKPIMEFVRKRLPKRELNNHKRVKGLGL